MTTNRLLARLARGDVLVADGAAGAMLQPAGLPVGEAPDRWNLDRPEAILALHRAYLDAGAAVILTNTFGGTRPRLAAKHLDDQGAAINAAGARLARAAAGDRAIVLGDMGPTGQMMPPIGPLRRPDAVAAFAEQAAALAQGGVDALLIETMSDLAEAPAAIEGAQQATDLPVLVTMSFDHRGRTMMGVKPEDAARALWALGVTAIGANCGRTLPETLAAVTRMREAAPQAVLIAKPNAGLPHLDGRDLVYDVTPAIMGDYTARGHKLRFGAGDRGRAWWAVGRASSRYAEDAPNRPPRSGGSAGAVASPRRGLPQAPVGNRLPVRAKKRKSCPRRVYARQFAALGVRIIGGCCGSTPDHIRAIAQALAKPL